MGSLGKMTIDLMSYHTKIIVNNKIIDNETLKWRHESNGLVELTLDEIAKQINTPGIIYVWIESGLRGFIYMYGNYNDDNWYEHGVTKGFA